MSNRRAILWLLAAIGLTLVAHLMLSYRGRVDNALLQRSSLFGTGAGAATRLELVRPGEVRTVLSRTGDWRLTAPYSSGVDPQAVLTLLGILMDSPVENSIGERDLRRLGRSRADFGLVSPRLTVSASGDGVDESVSFGDTTPDGSGVYASVGGEQAVYLVSSNVFAAVDLRPEGFRRRSLFTAAPEKADTLDVKRGTGSFVRFVRNGELWTIERESSGAVTAASGKVKTLFDGLAAASAEGFVWPRGDADEPASATASLLAAYGLDPENAVTVTLKRKGLPDQQVSFGRSAGEGLVYALVQGAEAVVTVSSALKDAALADISVFADDRLFPCARAQVSRLSLTDGETTYLLAKDSDGVWVLDAPVSAPTDGESVNALLDRLFALRSGDTNETGVAVSMTGRATPVTVSREAALDGLRLENLRSREILRIDPAGVKRVVVTGPKGTPPVAVVSDRDRNAWNVESAETSGKVDQAALDGVLSALNPLRAQWIVKMKVSASDLRNYGLESPRLTLAVDQTKDDSVRRNVLVGNDAQGGAFATVGSSDAVFVLPEDVVRRLSAPLVAEEVPEE